MMNNLGFNKPNSDVKIAVAMSGGIDSSVVAAKLKKNGYNVIGLTMRLYDYPNKLNEKKKLLCWKRYK